jgi:hypothetical protein
LRPQRLAADVIGGITIMRRRSLFVFNKWITACVRANEIPDEEEEEEEEESFLWRSVRENSFYGQPSNSGADVEGVGASDFPITGSFCTSVTQLGVPRTPHGKNFLSEGKQLVPRGVC